MNTTTTINEIRHPHLATAAAAAAKFCPGARCPRPVLQHVLVRVDDDGTTVAATDLSQSVLVRLPEGGGRGVALVPAKVAKSIGDSVRYSDSTVSAGGITSPSADPLEFPHQALLACEPSAKVYLPHADAIVKAVAPAIDAESLRYAFGGIRLEVEGDKLLAIASDGRRLHALSSPTSVANGGPIDAVVPVNLFAGLLKAVRQVAKDVLQKRGKKLEDFLFGTLVEIRKADSVVEARWSAHDVIVAVQAREFEGRFPKWRQVLPAGCFDTTTGITLDIDEAVAQVKAAGKATTPLHPAITFADGHVSAGHGSSGVFSAPVAGTITCPPVKLSPVFVADALAAVRAISPQEQAKLIVSDPKQAAFLHAEHYGLDLRVVLMPVAAD